MEKQGKMTQPSVLKCLSTSGNSAKRTASSTVDHLHPPRDDLTHVFVGLRFSGVFRFAGVSLRGAATGP